MAGTGEAGDTIIVTDKDNNTFTAIVDSNGKWSIQPNPLEEGEVGKIEAVDPAGNGSGQAELIGGDQTPPPAPQVTENNGTGLAGTGEAGDTIIVTDKDNNTFTAIVDSNGKWSIQPNPLEEGEVGKIEAVDPAGNGSGQAELIGGDQTPPVVTLDP
ncbi:Ig-like domain-containing protein, partial [Acinetobacter gerneri]|uniref:Ig-like domain-containing protein n=1 Tax=Acinetobacter gerneri TaxID=202952 RepID=UPI001D174532